MSKHHRQPGAHRDPSDQPAPDRGSKLPRHSLPNDVTGGMVEALRARDAERRNHQPKHER